MTRLPGIFLAVVSGAAAASAATLAIMPSSNPTVLANSILGTGIQLVPGSAVYRGGANSAGTFTNFSSGPWTNPITNASGSFTIPAGLILTSGDASCGAGTFSISETSYVNGGCSNTVGTAGDPDLDTLSGFPTFDAAVLEFDFKPDASVTSAFFNFVFASTEYPDYVNSPFNDAFAFIVNGNNIALVPGTATPIAVDTLNAGNPVGTDASNPAYFTQYSVLGVTPFNYGGVTRVFQLNFPVIPGSTNHIKLAIADASDEILDSAVLIQGGTFSVVPTPKPEDTVPEPASLALIGTGLVGLALLWRRIRK